MAREPLGRPEFDVKKDARGPGVPTGKSLPAHRFAVLSTVRDEISPAHHLILWQRLRRVDLIYSGEIDN